MLACLLASRFSYSSTLDIVPTSGCILNCVLAALEVQLQQQHRHCPHKLYPDSSSSILHCDVQLQ